MTDDCKPYFGNPVGPWHKWFAWHPIQTYDFRWIWLKTVERRGVQKHSSLNGGPNHWFQYRVIEKKAIK